MASKQEHRLDIVGNIPFITIHLSCLLIFWVGFSWTALITCFVLWFVRMFGITAGYHRYFSHNAYKTSRVFQFILALLGNGAAQLGPLWWAAHHRHHHRFSDMPEDLHSPLVDGMFWSHVGWVISPYHVETNEQAIRDFARFPELRFLNRFHMLAPIALATGVTGLGMLLYRVAPQLHTSGLQMLIWGFCLSTAILYHTTFTINSLAHVFGSRRFETKDNSRNNLFLALITLGEGWHNNHHYYPSSERQGFYWWEIDVSHYILTMLSWVGVVWDLKAPPAKVYEQAYVAKETRKQALSK